jgi:hypothetical protein
MPDGVTLSHGVDNSAGRFQVLRTLRVSPGLGEDVSNVVVDGVLELDPPQVRQIKLFLLDQTAHVDAARNSLRSAEIPEPHTGESMRGAAGIFAEAFEAVLDDVRFSTAGLTEAIGKSVDLYLSVDEVAAYRLFGCL